MHVVSYTGNSRSNYQRLVWCIFAAVFMFIVVLNKYEWEFLGYTLNPERLFALPLLMIAFIVALSRKKTLRFSTPTTFLSLWLCLALWSSAVSEVPAWALKMFFLQLIAISYYYAILMINPDPGRIFSSKFFLLLAWFLGPVMSTVYFISLSGVVLPDFMADWLQEGGGGTRIRATILEANLFGAFLTLVILCVVALKLTNKLWWWFLMLGLHFALFLSFSRAPWIAYFVGVFVYFILISSNPYTVAKAIKISVYALMFFVLIVGVSYFVYQTYGEYEIIARVDSVRTRFVMWELALDGIVKNPIFGNGIFSFSALNPSAPSLVGSETYRSAWISNLFLAVIHDTGIVGFLLFSLFLIYNIKNGWQVVRRASLTRETDPRRTRLAAALVASGVSLILSGQSIPAYSLAIFWVVFASIDSLKKWG